MASRAAKRLNSRNKISAIVALDPTSHGSSIMDVRNRLVKSDANFVEVMHTDTTKFGMLESIGHGGYHSFGDVKNSI